MRNYQPSDEPIPGYRLVKPLGQGSFGQVWKALGPGDVEVALKIIRGLDGRFAIREWQSLQAVMNLRHSNLSAIFGVWLKDENGAVLQKDQILALIPPDPRSIEPSAPESSSVTSASQAPGWTGKARQGSAPVWNTATLAAPTQLAGGEQAAPTTSAASAASETAGTGSQGSGSGSGSDKGSGSDRGSGSDPLSRALKSATTIPPLELVTAMTLGECTLMDRLNQSKAEGQPGIPREELLSYASDAAKGLQYLNEKHIQHCDIKPENLLVVGGSAQVCDYGSALKAIYNQEARTNQGVTREYAAPEQLAGKRVKLHKSTDQYALAMTYYALRTGKYPWKDDSAQPIEVIKHSESFDFSDLANLSPWQFELDVIRRALRKDPKNRFPSLTEFISELNLAAQREVEAQRELRRKFWRRIMAAACLLLVLALGGAGWRFKDQIRTWISPRRETLVELVRHELKSKPPTVEEFRLAIEHLQQALKKPGSFTKDQQEDLRSTLNAALKSSLDRAVNVDQKSEKVAAIDIWLKVLETVPQEFRSDELDKLETLAWQNRPLPDELERKVAGYIQAKRFSDALAWLKSIESKQDLRKLETTIRDAWLDEALDQSKVFDAAAIDGFQAFLDCRRALAGPDDKKVIDQMLQDAIAAKLNSAEEALRGSSAEWAIARSSFTVVRQFLSRLPGDLARLPAIQERKQVAALGELAAEARLAESGGANSWQTLQQRLSAMDAQSAPRRHQFLTAWFAERLSPDSELQGKKPPLLDDGVLDAVTQLKKVDDRELAPWEREKLDEIVVLVFRLAEELTEKNPGAISADTESKIKQISQGGLFRLELARAQNALLRKPEPDLAAATKALAAANQSAESAPKDEQRRLLVLMLWLQLVDPGARAAVTSAGLESGIAAFVNGSSSEKVEAGVLDALYDYAALSPAEAKAVVEAAGKVTRAEGNVASLELVTAQAQVARLPSDLALAAPDWKSLGKEWKLLVDKRDPLEKSRQAPDSKFRRALILLDAAFLEASASVEPPPPLDKSIQGAFARITSDVQDKPAVESSPPLDGDYINYVIDLAELTWRDLNASGQSPKLRFSMAKSKSPLLASPRRRRVAADWVLRFVDGIGLPTDETLKTKPDAQSMAAALSLLDLAQAWLNGIATPEDQVAIAVRWVRAEAYASDRPDWKEIDNRMGGLLAENQREAWRKEGILGQLLLIAARAAGLGEQSEEGRQRAVLAYSDFSSEIVDAYKSNDAFPDVDVYREVVLPATALIKAGTSPPEDAPLRQAYARIFGLQGRLIARDRNHLIAQQYLNEKDDPLAAKTVRRVSFAKAALHEPDPKPKARWMVEEARSILDASSDLGADDGKDILDLVEEALRHDPDLHSAYAVRGYVRIRQSRALLGSNEVTASTRAREADEALVKANKLLESASPEEQRQYGCNYLEDLSAACLVQAFLVKNWQRDEARKLLVRARDLAEESRTKYPDEERVNPANAYTALGNAYEDFAFHAVVPTSEIDQNYKEAIERFQKAVEWHRGIPQGAACEFDLGRCQFRYAWKGVNLSASERVDAFREADESLSRALTQFTDTIKDDEAAVQTQFFLAQLAYQRALFRFNQEKSPEQRFAVLQRELQGASKRYDDTVRLCKATDGKQYLGLFRADQIDLVVEAVFTLRNLRNAAPEVATREREWREKFESLVSDFWQDCAEYKRSASFRDKLTVIGCMIDAEEWQLTNMATAADRQACKSRQAALIDRHLPLFARGAADRYRIDLLERGIALGGTNSDLRQLRGQWIKDLLDVASTTVLLNPVEREMYVARANGHYGLWSRIELKNAPPEKQPALAVSAMRSYRLAVEGNRKLSQNSEQSPGLASAAKNYGNLFGLAFDLVGEPNLSYAAEDERRQYYDWLLQEYDGLEKNSPLRADNMTNVNLVKSKRAQLSP